jgi:peptide/nickel transport system substrate-binding protein
MPFRFGPLALGILLIAACGAPVPSANTITVALDQPPTNLDPRIGTDAASERLTQLMFSSLVRRNEASEIVPDLARDWDIPDPQTYVFRLREDVRFHDGRPLGARDVVFTFASILDGSVRTAKAGTYRVIESVDAPDPFTVRFRLREPYAPFLWNLSLGAIGIVPEGTPAGDSRSVPPGSGPFVFRHYRQDDEILLTRNDAYFDSGPHIENVRFRIVADAVVRALELRNGSLDIALNALPPDMVETLRDEPHLAVLNGEGSNYQYLAFNLEDPAFSDPRVRQAVAHAIDRESIVRHLWRGQARLADSLLPPENWAYFGGGVRYAYDPERARDLLEAAGREDLAFTYKTSTDPTGLLVAAVLQDQFGKLGIRMDIRSNEFATFYSDIIAGSFQMYSLRWIGGNNDPDMFNLVFHSAMEPPNGANRGHYRNPDVDRWIELARRESDPEIRKVYYRQILEREQRGRLQPAYPGYAPPSRGRVPVSHGHPDRSRLNLQLR